MTAFRRQLLKWFIVWFPSPDWPRLCNLFLPISRVCGAIVIDYEPTFYSSPSSIKNTRQVSKALTPYISRLSSLPEPQNRQVAIKTSDWKPNYEESIFPAGHILTNDVPRRRIHTLIFLFTFAVLAAPRVPLHYNHDHSFFPAYKPQACKPIRLRPRSLTMVGLRKHAVRHFTKSFPTGPEHHKCLLDTWKRQRLKFTGPYVRPSIDAANAWSCLK